MEGWAAAEAFVADPGAWAEPALAAPLIAPGLSADTARRLLASPRLAGRASRLLADRLGWGEAAALEPPDLALVCASGAALRALAVCAGAVWHVRRLRSLVLGTDIALLVSRLGEATRGTALRHAALAPEAGGDSPATDDAAALADDVERDGMRCVAAWIDVLPDWAAARMRLKWQGGSESPVDAQGLDAQGLVAEPRGAAVRIVRALAAEVPAA
jgi:hypothetical protein